MESFPPLRRDADFDSGHLWLREHVLGGRLRFRYDGGFNFGDETDAFAPGEEPLAVAAAVEAVRAEFAGKSFTAEVEEPSDYTFYGVATREEGVTYDWARLPAFLGTAICRPDGSLLPVDVAHAAFERLGLVPLNVFERELPARDFDFEHHDTPASAWYDGPAAGTRIRQKDGPETVFFGPVGEPVSTAEGCSPEAFVDQYVTPERVAETTAALAAPSVERVRDRLLARLVRRHYAELADTDGLRAAAMEPVARYR
ncbi:hypothetical protein [Halosegnis sp.]|uniref:hypothetical protein n=1 Tax=Halosegnis sp. TaxID=2864959 RepID=UPI0035D3DD15